MLSVGPDEGECQMSYYDVAQVCINGHLVNDRYRGRPQHNKRFCTKCGAQTIAKCPACGADIQGDYIVEGVITIGAEPPPPPAFCHNCGKPFPWTEARLEAMRELTQEVGELGDEREKLVGSLPDLVVDTPRTQLAAARWRKALAKVGDQVKPAIMQMLIEIATEGAKKLLFPGT